MTTKAYLGEITNSNTFLFTCPSGNEIHVPAFALHFLEGNSDYLVPDEILRAIGHNLFVANDCSVEELMAIVGYFNGTGSEYIFQILDVINANAFGRIEEAYRLKALLTIESGKHVKKTDTELLRDIKDILVYANMEMVSVDKAYAKKDSASFRALIRQVLKTRLSLPMPSSQYKFVQTNHKEYSNVLENYYTCE
jgi:hypothetical protein